MHTHAQRLLVALFLLTAGCARTPTATEAPLAPPDAPAHTSAAPSGNPSVDAGKIKVIAYINVTSGCQAPTVNLVNKLGMDYADIVDMEIVDFGSPEGQERWRADGMDCMGILFNGSPVMKMATPDGPSKTIAFMMPAGFSWSHEDLEQAFAGLKDGSAQILSEEQAKKEFAPRPITLKTGTRSLPEGVELQIGGTPMFVVQAKAADKTPDQRVAQAQAALEQWTQNPIHPSQLTAKVAKDSTITLMAGEQKIIRITAADAEAAQVLGPAKLAEAWLTAIKQPVVEAFNQAPASASP